MTFGKVESEKKPSVKKCRTRPILRQRQKPSSSTSFPKQKEIPDSVWKFYCIPVPKPEYMFHPIRKWRIDYAWPEYKVALEIEGGVWTNGRHVRPSGYIKDMEKYNSMEMYGWLLLRYVPAGINYGQIRNAIELRKALL